MESLRWILLIAGITFVVVIYFLGRSRRQRHHSMVDELEDNLPEFPADNLDELDEGVGAVRIITAEKTDDPLLDEEITAIAADAGETAASSGQESQQSDSGIIVLYILAKPDQYLIGSQINSSVQAMGLSFGEMNIFHYRPHERNIFSLANMHEPGSFDAEHIHDLKTTGLTVFMQIQGDDPLDDLTEMLQRSYQLAGLLDAVLCSHQRKPLTEQDAENYRLQVAAYMTEAVAS